VTVRERDSAAQVRLPAKAVPEELTALLGDQTFNTLLERYDTVDTDVTTS
jgi:glycyl-tRNA synthetase